MKKKTIKTNGKIKNAAKMFAAGGIAGVLALGSIGCSKDVAENEPVQQENVEQVTYPSVDELDLDFSKRDLDYSYDENDAVKVSLSDNGIDIAGHDASGVSATDSTVTLSKAGTYVLAGSLSDGEIVVDAGDEDKIQVVFDGVDVTNGDGPAMLVQNADKVFVTLAQGSDNVLSDGSDYALEGDDNKRDAALFSHDDLTINGTGSLDVNGNYKHGIVSKDDLVLCGATIKVTSKEDAMQGNDCVKSIGCDIDIEAGDDAIKSDQFVYFKDGDVEVKSCYEGYEAVKVIIDGGNHDITASDDAINAALPSDDSESTMDNGDVPNPPSMPDGDAKMEMKEKRTENEDGSGSDAHRGGRMMRDPNDSDTDAQFVQGQIQDKTGQRPDRKPDAENANGIPDDFPEDPVEAVPSDEDRFGKGDFNKKDEFGGHDMAQSSDACLILINGGTINISGGNDGLDSNGNIEIKGGTVLVSGPNNGMDGAMDYDLNAKVDGGTVLMSGSVASMRGLDESDQPYAMVSASGKKGSKVSLIDENGNEIASLIAKMSFNNVFVSSKDIASGDLFVIDVDGTPYDVTMG